MQRSLATMMLVLTIPTLLGCGASKQLGNLSDSIRQLGESGVEAADKIDPIAVKEIFRALRDAESDNDALRAANQKLVDEIANSASRGYLLIDRDDVSLKLEYAAGGGRIFAELEPKDGKAPFRVFDGEPFSDRLSFGPDEGRVYLTPQLRSGGHFVLRTWFEGSGRIRVQVQTRRGADSPWQSIRLIGMEDAGVDRAKIQPLWIGRSQ